MYDLAVAILGNEDTTYNNAADLLDDYLPENCVVLVPSYIKTDGMKSVLSWLRDSGVEYERHTKSELRSVLREVDARKKALIVTGTEDNEQLIASFMLLDMPVFDLTRGLYSVTAAEIALDGSVSDVDGITETSSQDSLGERTEGASERSEAVTLHWEDKTNLLEDLKIRTETGTIYRLWGGGRNNLLYIGKTATHLLHRLRAHKTPTALGKNFLRIKTIDAAEVPITMMGEIESRLIHQSHPPLNNYCPKCRYYTEIVNKETEVNKLKAHVGIAEHGWEPQVSIPVFMQAEPEINTEHPGMDGTVKYYKNGKGKYRRAGKSKPRPGEKEIWLSEDEVESLTS